MSDVETASADTVPSDPSPENLAIRRPRMNPEEEETLEKIIESLGGAVSGKLKLRIQRREKSRGWKNIRPILIEDWMVEDGLDIPEIIGETYGDGFYRWQLRFSGRYVRKGDCQVEGYPEISPEAAYVDDPEPVQQPVDLGSVLSGFKADILREIRPPEQSFSPASLAEAVKAAVEPLVRLVEARLTHSQVSPPAPPPPSQPPGPDPTVAAILAMLSKQSAEMLSFMGKTVEAAKARPETVMNPVSGTKAQIADLKELLSLVRELGAVQPPPVGILGVEPAGDEISEETGDEADADTDDAVYGRPEEISQESSQSSIFSGLGSALSGAASRVAQHFISRTEEQVKSGLLAGTAAVSKASAPAAPLNPAEGKPAVTAVPSAAPSSPPGSSDDENVRQYEGLVALLEACASRKMTDEEFDREILSSLDSGAVKAFVRFTPGQVIEAGRGLGRPDLADRLNRPEVRVYLDRAYERLLRKAADS